MHNFDFLFIRKLKRHHWQMKRFKHQNLSGEQSFTTEENTLQHAHAWSFSCHHQIISLYPWDITVTQTMLMVTWHEWLISLTVTHVSSSNDPLHKSHSHLIVMSHDQQSTPTCCHSPWSSLSHHVCQPQRYQEPPYGTGCGLMRECSADICPAAGKTNRIWGKINPLWISNRVCHLQYWHIRWFQCHTRQYQP